MTQPPTQGKWEQAFSQSHDLDPTSKCWGLFAVSDAPPPVCGSGMGSFHWFQTEAELVSFIRDYLAWWNPAPSTMKREEIAATVQAIVAAESADLKEMVDCLNDFMRNMWYIEWCGQFVDLCEGKGEFPVRVRSGFFDDDEMPESIPLEYLREFMGYLQTYGI